MADESAMAKKVVRKFRPEVRVGVNVDTRPMLDEPSSTSLDWRKEEENVHVEDRECPA